jgi:hypothetical protein
MENVTKEELVDFINILLSVMDDSHIYPEELFEERTPLECRILALTKYNWILQQ